ncbi:TetR/AcrR family transcriptional regulator [Rhodococcus sp. ZPP]|uniref:TetR/AcrR family transcriptional regulator n=1 Tax=Rhodococcus sp. ZPP TaxID=2749906 RepID=UPI001AD8530C|nr:TetR/AcrR family transcriptional regulator [Rhodococcus sp. ZPP]QTJ68812.1 TetR/AcrR family transcriptional regulator [Rhodococcus sp. ZPP]
MTVARTNTAAGAATERPIRRRPKDRKAQIATVAAEAFSERGYHAVGVDDIAATIGISGPALYRHYPNKYALFVHAATTTADALRTAADDALAGLEEAAAGERLDRLISALVTNTIEHRKLGGLYRWEGRYLQADDRIRIRNVFVHVTQCVAAPLRELRPELSAVDATTQGAATLSVMASISAHRTALATRRLHALLTSACESILRTTLPPAVPTGEVSARVEGAGGGLTMTSKRELLINEAVHIFDRNGYHDSSIEEIGAAAGINASSVYRHFPSKADLLAAVFYRAADRLAVATSAALSAATDPREALCTLAESYLELAFRNPAVLSVYFAEIGNLPENERRNLRNVQRLHVEEWVHLVTAVRSELSAAEARFLVQAALGLVLDIGRLIHFDTAEESRARLHALMVAVLLGQ